MSSPDIEALFRDALALAPADRERFIAASARGDPSVIAEVERRLAASASPVTEADSALAERVAEQLSRLKPEEPGDIIGPYKLMEQIGEGGFGTVWVAAQERPVRRRVALKVIKLGMDTKEVIARFEQERQALAVMDHPHIAKVFDAGATQWGRPYFVMELVRGIRLTDYCDQENLTIPDRIALMIQVCHAVQHAHQKGIIHRDLKPSNILVTLHDGAAVPKVIDFGVAKATQQQRFTDLTIYTQFQQMIGTPLYMSPEQAEMSGLDIDTRSDIYSLGVLLYELITGRTPFDPEILLNQGIDEMRQAIREQEPQTPATFLRSLPDATRAMVAQRRRTESAKLAKLVRGDLDWIVMKAIDKDRSRRYETANGLAMDLRRYLASEPVLARPPSRLYKLRRLARRNRAVFFGGGAVLAGLLGGLGVATHAWIDERAARASEKAQRQIADQRTREAQINAEIAAASEQKGRRFLYAADMSLANQSLEINNIGRARQLLDRHRPGPGEIDLRGWEWRYLWQQCRTDAFAMLTRREDVRAFTVSFSPDSRWLAVGFSDGQVELWDIVKRQRSKVIQEPSNWYAHVAFSPRGNVLASTAGKNAVNLHNIATGLETEFCTLSGPVRDLSFSADGEWLAVRSHQPDLVQILRVEDRKLVLSHTVSDYSGMNAFFNNARISPDKQRLYLTSGEFYSPKVQCLSIADHKVLWEIGDVPPDTTEPEQWRDVGFRAMDLSPDGKTLVVSTGYSQHFARVLDASSGRFLKALRGHKLFVSGFKFSDDGKWLATSSSDQTLRLWDTATWESQPVPFRGHNQEVHGIAMTGDGKLLASASKDGEVLLWETQTSRASAGSRRLPAHVESAHPLPVGDLAMCRSTDGRWSLIHLVTLEEKEIPAGEISRAESYPRFALRYFPPSRRLPAIRRTGFPGNFTEAVLSPDRKLVAVPSEGGLVALYNASEAEPCEILRGSMDTIFRAAFTPDNQRLILSNGGTRGLALWDLTTRQELITVPVKGSLLMTLRVSSDGNAIIVKSNGRRDEGAGSWHVFRAPSFAEIEAAEASGGRWGYSQSLAASPMPGIAETKLLLEKYLRERLDRTRSNADADPTTRDEALAELAFFLRGLDRPAEAEPFLRELLALYEAQFRPDEPAILQTTATLLETSLKASRTKSGVLLPDIDANSQGAGSRETDALIDKFLKLLTARSEANLNDVRLSLLVPLLHVWFGNDAEHLRLCESLMAVGEDDSASAIEKERAALAVCTHPGRDAALFARALRLARQAAEIEKAPDARPWLLRCVGIAEYRAGNDAAAEETFLRARDGINEATIPDSKLRAKVAATIDLFRAMIYQRKGEVEEARKLFELAAKKSPAPPVDAREVLVNGAREQELIHWLAYREAKEMIEKASGGGTGK